jgi:hypothetical protein
MTLKDKLEIGLKKDAGIRKDNLTPDEVRGPEVPAGPGRSPVIPAARHDMNEIPRPVSPPKGEQEAIARAEEEEEFTSDDD